MKAIMYHYIRQESGGMPFLRYLGLDDFRKQLDYFAEHFGFIGKDEFLETIESGRPNSDGVVLTFDDGFNDHYDHVLPELKRRGLSGMFYVPTMMYTSRRLLEVHRVHVLLGTHGGATILDALQDIVTDEMLSHDHVSEFHNQTYSRQRNDESTTLVKRTLNYFISYDFRETVLDRLMEIFFPGESYLVSEFYMTPQKIREMQDAGMIVGSHSVSHPVFSKLDDTAQRKEIEDSFSFLDEVTGGLSVRTFCYPYGGFHTFTATTERLLEELGSRFSFNVEARDIGVADLTGRIQALPRYDCNLFPYGSARFG